MVETSFHMEWWLEDIIPCSAQINFVHWKISVSAFKWGWHENIEASLGKSSNVGGNVGWRIISTFSVGSRKVPSSDQSSWEFSKDGCRFVFLTYFYLYLMKQTLVYWTVLGDWDVWRRYKEWKEPLCYPTPLSTQSISCYVITDWVLRSEYVAE